MKYNIVKTSKVVKTPAYVQHIYGKLYENETVSRFFDDERIVSLVTCFQQYKMIDDVVKEISTNSSVLQLGCTFGRQIEATAEKVGAYGKYVIADVTPIQVERCKSKTIYQKINFLSHDVSKAFSEKFDTVICYMLLHELPLPAKSKLINQALSGLTPGGKAIFIDYNNMAWWHPLKWFVKMYNRLYQPFAERMWQTEIKDYVTDRQQFEWRKTTYFGKMYQKVVVTKKSSLF